MRGGWETPEEEELSFFPAGIIPHILLEGETKEEKIFNSFKVSPFSDKWA